ncbi:hypothetical protein KM043_001308 [Ampulex compressa]|nr:hypothetical protein KM043_001308 [Ampulex compressa]
MQSKQKWFQQHQRHHEENTKDGERWKEASTKSRAFANRPSGGRANRSSCCYATACKSLATGSQGRNHVYTHFCMHLRGETRNDGDAHVNVTPVNVDNTCRRGNPWAVVTWAVSRCAKPSRRQGYVGEKPRLNKVMGVVE